MKTVRDVGRLKGTVSKCFGPDKQTHFKGFETIKKFEC